MSVRAAGGFTIVEMSIVAVVLTVISAIIAQSIFGLSRAQTSLRNDMRASALAERIVAAMEADAASTMRMFSEDADGRAYLAQLDLACLLANGAKIIDGSRMPISTMLGKFERDPVGSVQTGNLLLLVRNDGTVTCETALAPGSEPRRVDLLRFVVWFLHTGAETGVDLGRYCSGRLARLEDVQAVADPAARVRLVQSLRTLGVLQAWSPSAAPSVAFQHLNADGTAAPMAAGALLAPDRQASQANVLGSRFLGVARNNTVPMPIPKLARATAQFPHGFEVKHDGDGSGDLVLIRLVIASQGGAGRAITAAESTRQVAFRSE